MKKYLQQLANVYVACSVYQSPLLASGTVLQSSGIYMYVRRHPPGPANRKRNRLDGVIHLKRVPSELQRDLTVKFLSFIQSCITQARPK